MHSPGETAINLSRIDRGYISVHKQTIHSIPLVPGWPPTLGRSSPDPVLPTALSDQVVSNPPSVSDKLLREMKITDQPVVGKRNHFPSTWSYVIFSDLVGL